MNFFSNSPVIKFARYCSVDPKSTKRCRPTYSADPKIGLGLVSLKINEIYCFRPIKLHSNLTKITKDTCKYHHIFSIDKFLWF